MLSDAASAGARSEAAEARARAAEERERELVDAIRLEVLAADQDVREAAVARETSARGLAAAEESYRARRLLYPNGRATTVELLDAETDLTRARLDALGAAIDARVAAVRLAYAGSLRLIRLARRAVRGASARRCARARVRRR